MRFAVLLALALLGCAPTQAARCDLQVDTPLRFSDANADDVVTARAIGPSCEKLTALYIVSAPDGGPVWSWTSPFPRAFGDHFHRAEKAEVEEFLARWAAPSVATTAAAPPWPEQADGLSDGFHTTLDRDTYEHIRARELPMLCHLTSVGRETCIFWEPAAAGAGALFERPVIVEGEEPA